MTRAGAFDPALGVALSLASAIRARNGDLPGALAALDEAAMQQHADGSRLGLGVTLRIAAALLAGLGQAEPAAVLSGAATANFAPVGDIYPDERLDMDQGLLPVREALGEAARGAALGRGAAMDDNEVVGYAVSEFRRVAAMLAESGTQAPESTQAWRS